MGLCSATCSPEEKRVGIGGKQGPLEEKVLGTLKDFAFSIP